MDASAWIMGAVILVILGVGVLPLGRRGGVDGDRGVDGDGDRSR